MNLLKHKKSIDLINQLYDTAPCFVSCDLFWDGGIRPESSLKEKADFYALAYKMSCVIKELISQLQEQPLIGSDYCENGQLYQHWSDLRSYETYRELRDRLGNTKSTTLKLPEEQDLIDLIVEANFRYFSQAAIFLPKTKAILCPSCHSEIIVYAQEDCEVLLTLLQQLAQKYSDETMTLRITPPHQKQSDDK